MSIINCIKPPKMFIFRLCYDTRWCNTPSTFPTLLFHQFWATVLVRILRLQLLAANMDSTHVFPLAVYVRVKSLTCAWLLVSCHNPKRIFLPLRQHVHNPVIIYNYKWNLSLNPASPHAFHCFLSSVFVSWGPNYWHVCLLQSQISVGDL